MSKKLLIRVTYSTESRESIDKRRRKSRPSGDDLNHLETSSIVSPLASFLTTAELQRKTDAEKGWVQYNKFMDILDTELSARGLTSIQQTGAQDLAIIKDAFINKLAVQTDVEGKPVFDKKTGEYARTAWYDDYLDDDGSKTNRVIAGLGKILNNEEFVKNNKNNTTWKSVNRYLEFRKSIAQELLSREVKSLNAKSNADLRIVFDAIINKLKQDDKLGFTYIYDRFLSQDLTVDKQLTPKAVK